MLFNMEKTGYINNGYVPETLSNGSMLPYKNDHLDSKKKEEEKAEEDEDPWTVADVHIEHVPWSELSAGGKLKRVTWDYIGRVVFLFGFLYLFICSLDFLSSAFRLLGGRAAGEVFQENEVLRNPFCGVMIGILATVLLQSSSTTTSLIVSMVGAQIFDVKTAIPIIMGANIGTTITNTFVSLGQITNIDDFRRAFAGASIHDMFNWLSVLVFLPVEIATGYLYRFTKFLVDNMNLSTYAEADQDFLKIITEPFTKLIVQVDKSAIAKIAQGEDVGLSIIKHCCKSGSVEVQRINATDVGNFTYNGTEKICLEKCRFLFENVANSWSDTTIGAILLIIAIAILCTCLICIVKILQSILQSKIAIVLKKFVNADFPGKCSYFTGYIAMLIGIVLTILVQSSSVFTASCTPLVGIGVITVERMYPLSLGSNIGTTATAVLAALASDIEDIPLTLQVALCHLFFNLSGIILYYPIPALRFPIRIAKTFGQTTAKYRWFPIVYITIMFLILPATVLGLSLISWIALACVFGPIGLIFIAVLVINVLQSKFPKVLPRFLRNWQFLPSFMHSLRPYDNVIRKIGSTCCRCCKSCKEVTSEESEGIHHDSTLYGEEYEATPVDTKVDLSLVTRL